MRVLANLSINEDVGQVIASNSDFTHLLLSVVGKNSALILPYEMMVTVHDQVIEAGDNLSYLHAVLLVSMVL